MFQIQKATKTQLKLKIAVEGVSGAGKTYGALAIASGIVSSMEKVVVIDTENATSAFYSDLFPGFSQLKLEAPYTPERFVQAIDYCVAQGFEVAIIDSLSHEWDGEGGILQEKEKSDQLSRGNSYTNWGPFSARHKACIDHIRHAPIHVISTLRKKTDYLQDTDDKGKKVIRKVGLKAVQREGTDYEFDIVFEVDQKTHYCEASKDRTNLFKDNVPFVISKETGKKLVDWANSGHATEVAAPAPVNTAPAVKQTVVLLNSPEYQQLRQKALDLYNSPETPTDHKQAISKALGDIKNRGVAQITVEEFGALKDIVDGDPR